jgi:hypothetical protein
VAQLFPRALISLFVASYDSQGYGGGNLEVDGNFRQTVGQSVLVSGAHLSPVTIFLTP